MIATRSIDVFSCAAVTVACVLVVGPPAAGSAPPSMPPLSNRCPRRVDWVNGVLGANARGVARASGMHSASVAIRVIAGAALGDLRRAASVPCPAGTEP